MEHSFSPPVQEGGFIQEKGSREISVVIPISDRHDDINELYGVYSDELTRLGKDFEFLFVLDGDFPTAYSDLISLQKKGHPIRIIKFSKHFGESRALMEGFRQARGDKVLTLASYIQIEPKDLARVFLANDEGYSLVITRRFPRIDPRINRIQSAIYHFLVRKLTGAPYRDITSGMRLINKEILSEFALYGDLHRFIPIFAMQKGIKTKEVKVTQREEDTQVRMVKPGIYLRRILDLLTLFFLVKFTKKPLRFFGLIGSTLLLTGLSISTYLVILRLFSGQALSNRPLLLLGILFMVFGIQLVCVGLVGELILFSHAKELQDYKITELIE